MKTNREAKPVLGSKAPFFEANTTHGNIRFPDDFKGKWVIFFSHPADFTPVCSTEFIAFARKQQELKALNTELIALSVDTMFKHSHWIHSIEEALSEKEGLSIDFPVIDDSELQVATKYDMIHPDVSEVLTVRTLYIIDPEGTIQLITHYPEGLGRSVDEIIRSLRGLQKLREERIAIPANWVPGDDVIAIPHDMYLDSVEARMAKDNSIKECIDWYLCFKEDIEE